MIAIFSPALKHAKKAIIDYGGAALLAVALATLILAVDNTESIFAGLLDATGLTLGWLRAIMFTIVAAAIAGFVVVERKAKEPILSPSFFKNRNYVLIITIATLFGAAFMGSILYLTQFNQQVFGASPTTSGLMLLPLVAGIMVTSIGTGQIISKTGRYKIFFQVGFVLATVAMILLTTLTPSIGYGYEAFIMVLLGLGMGVAMPILNLAIQNEFEQKDLGAATSSNQLFRSLGATIGTAVFGAVLTAGIVANISNINSTDYVKSLAQNPQASQIGSFDDANTLLRLNTPDTKAQITDAADASFAKLPPAIAAEAKSDFKAQQTEFAGKVTNAFSDSLHTIFLVASGLMIVATILAFTLKERPLHAASPLETPGEA
jgi:Na+/melibiose symporter-like transporter